jgi:hypothetical protein
MTINEIKESLECLSDDELNSLINVIREQSNKRKNERVKIAFEDFKNAALKLDELLDIDYNIEGEGYTMYGIICSVGDAIKEEGYPL